MSTIGQISVVVIPDGVVTLVTTAVEILTVDETLGVVVPGYYNIYWLYSIATIEKYQV